MLNKVNDSDFLVIFNDMKRLIVVFLWLLNVINAQAQFIKPEQNESVLATQLFQQGEYEKVVSLLEKFANSNNTNERFDYLYINSLIKINKTEEAEKYTKKQMSKFPKQRFYAIALGNLYLEKGQLAESNKIFENLINKLTSDEFNINDLANSFYNYSLFDYMIKTYQQGRKLLKNDNLFTSELISIYKYKKDKEMLASTYLELLPTKPQLITQAQQNLANVFEDKTDYQNFQILLLKKIQKDPDQTVFTELLIWNYIQQQQFDAALRQVLAFDKRSKGDGEMVYKTSLIFLENEDYTTALQAFEYLLTKGANNPYELPAKIQTLNIKYLLNTKSNLNPTALTALAVAYKQLLDTYGRNKNTLFAIQKLANLQAYYMNQAEQATITLEQALKIPGISDLELGQIKLDLGDIYVSFKQPWEAFLLYEQVSKQFEGQVLGNEARFKSAKLSFFQGNFEYANAQCLILKTATSQFIANDALNLSLLISDNTQSKTDSLALKMYADAEMLAEIKLPQLALKKLDSIGLSYPNNSLQDAILMSKAKILIKNENYLSASETLKKIIDQSEQGIWTDDALFLLANLYELQLNNVQQAKFYYQKLISDYPGSMINAEARKRFRNLRGDDINQKVN